jgi:hypothetical protein
LRGLCQTPAERLPHYGLHVLGLKTLAGTPDAHLESSLQLEILRPQPLVFELGDECAPGE